MYMGKVSLSLALSFSLVCANMNTLIVSFAIFYICVVLYRCPLFLSLSFSAYFPSAFKVKISSVTSSISAA